MIARRDVIRLITATAATRHLPFALSPDAAAAEDAGPAYVLEFGIVMHSLHQDFAAAPREFSEPQRTGTLRMIVNPDNTWTVHAGNYVKELGWENIPISTREGSPDTSAVALMRWLAETVLHPQRFDASGIIPSAAV